jgi:hypothetical protein
MAHIAMKNAEADRDAAKAELASAKKAHEAALAAKPKKAKPAKPAVETMTKEQIEAELASIDDSADEVVQH